MPQFPAGYYTSCSQDGWRIISPRKLRRIYYEAALLKFSQWPLTTRLDDIRDRLERLKQLLGTHSSRGFLLLPMKFVASEWTDLFGRCRRDLEFNEAELPVARPTVNNASNYEGRADVELFGLPGDRSTIDVHESLAGAGLRPLNGVEFLQLVLRHSRIIRAGSLLCLGSSWEGDGGYVYLEAKWRLSLVQFVLHKDGADKKWPHTRFRTPAVPN